MVARRFNFQRVGPCMGSVFYQQGSKMYIGTLLKALYKREPIKGFEFIGTSHHHGQNRLHIYIWHSTITTRYLAPEERIIWIIWTSWTNPAEIKNSCNRKKTLNYFSISTLHGATLCIPGEERMGWEGDLTCAPGFCKECGKTLKTYVNIKCHIV